MSEEPRDGDGGSDRRPRLLVLTPDFPPSPGGIQVLVHRLVREMSAFRTRVVTLDAEGARDFDATSPLAVRRVRAPARLGAGRNMALNAIAVREASSFRPQLTLSAHIVTSPAAAVIRRTLGARTAQYFYAKEIADRPRLAAFAARRADAAISISSYTTSLLAAAGAARDSLRVIPPGVDLPSDPSPQSWPRPTVLTISRLTDRYKGHDVLVRALETVRERVPDVEWVVIGDGPLRLEVEALAGSHGLAGSARFLGAASDAERDTWLRRADVLAMPSRLPGPGRAGEGFGIVYLEAGAFGKPVVAGNVAGAVDAVLDGESGLLVDPTDAGAVAEAITTLLVDEQLAKRLGAGGAGRARSLAWPSIAAQVQQLLLEQLPGRPLRERAKERDEREGQGGASG